MLANKLVNKFTTIAKAIPLNAELIVIACNVV